MSERVKWCRVNHKVLVWFHIWYDVLLNEKQNNEHMRRCKLTSINGTHVQQLSAVVHFEAFGSLLLMSVENLAKT